VRRGVVALVVVLLLVVVADRVAAEVTGRRLAAEVQRAEHLSGRPRVTIHGFPFLTQVASGRYGDVGLDASSVIVVRGVRIEHAAARLHAVRVDVHDVLAGTVRDLPVGSGSGSAVVPYPSVNLAVTRYGGRLGSAVSVGPAGPGRARLAGALGLSVRITARVSHGELVITPAAADLAALPSFLADTVQGALAQPIPLPPLPFNVSLVDARFEPDGLHLAAAAENSRFPVR
jgi:hypothetical protein